jgi:hypothetical protein
MHLCGLAFLPKWSGITFTARLDEIFKRKTAERWADDAESRNGRRLPHNSGLELRTEEAYRENDKLEKALSGLIMQRTGPGKTLCMAN